MPLTLALTESDESLIGDEALAQLIEGYSEAFPTLNLLADVVIVDTTEMQRLNREHREIDEPTDVLSFPTIPDFSTLSQQAQTQPTLMGTVIICPAKATEYGETLIQLVHHGLLHLLGYDHETDVATWISEEGRILEQLKRHNLVIPAIPYESV
jgi:probable rRNA maturation factor